MLIAFKLICSYKKKKARKESFPHCVKFLIVLVGIFIPSTIPTLLFRTQVPIIASVQVKTLSRTACRDIRFMSMRTCARIYFCKHQAEQDRGMRGTHLAGSPPFPLRFFPPIAVPLHVLSFPLPRSRRIFLVGEDRVLSPRS